MTYETFEPHPDLAAFVKAYWELHVPGDMEAEKQRVLPEGSIEMAFILANDVKRFTSEEEFELQPRAMIIGQITEPYFVQPTGEVLSFAVSFYTYGFANFVDRPISELANRDTPLDELFGHEEATQLEQQMMAAKETQERIKVVEAFLMGKLAEAGTIDRLVKSTVDALFETKGSQSILSLVEDQPTSRRSLERKFRDQVGMSPKQLGKVVRLQAALKTLLNNESQSLTEVAYDNDYYDQAHFTKDFKELTGSNPKDFLGNDQMILSSLFYSKD